MPVSTASLGPVCATAPTAGEVAPAVIAAIVDGDASAARAFVETYQERVLALVERLLGADRAVAEDIGQECFVRALRALPRFRTDDRAKISTWLLTIATRLVIDTVRARRSSRIDAAVDVVTLSDAGPAADERAQREQLLGAVNAAIAQLPIDQRAAFLLRVFHGLDHAAIAAALDIDVGAVKSRIARARATLRAAFPEETHGR